MTDLLIVSKNFNELFTTCKENEVNASIERAKESYREDFKLCTEHLKDYPENADYWRTQVKRYSLILQYGFEAVTWEEYEKRQREKYLSDEPKEITSEEYDYFLNVLPPMEWIRNERYSMFFVSECYTMTYYRQCLYDKETGKYYSTLADLYDKSTWIDKRLNLS